MGSPRRWYGLVPMAFVLFVVGLLGCQDRPPDSGAKVDPETKVAAGTKADAPSVAEVARLRDEMTYLCNEIQLLDKDIKTLVNQLAKERVEVIQLKMKVDEMAATQSSDKERITVRAEAIKKAEGHVTFGNRTLTVAAAKAELEVDVKRYTAAQKSLAAHESLFANRIKILYNIEKQLEATKNQKSELNTRVDAMEAEHPLLKLQQAESPHQTDDARLTKIKEDLRELRLKIDMKSEELKLTQVPPGEKSVDDILAPLNPPAKKP